MCSNISVLVYRHMPTHLLIRKTTKSKGAGQKGLELEIYDNYYKGSRSETAVGKESARNAGDAGSIPGREDPLEKRMATHSHILAWKTSWTEEPGRLQSMGSQRVRHD